MDRHAAATSETNRGKARRDPADPATLDSMAVTQDRTAASRSRPAAIRFVAGVIGCRQNRYLGNRARTAENNKAATHLPSTLAPVPCAWLVACPNRQREQQRHEAALPNVHLMGPFQKPSIPNSQHGATWAGHWFAPCYIQALRSIFQVADENPLHIEEHLLETGKRTPKLSATPLGQRSTTP